MSAPALDLGLRGGWGAALRGAGLLLGVVRFGAETMVTVIVTVLK